MKFLVPLFVAEVDDLEMGERKKEGDLGPASDERRRTVEVGGGGIRRPCFVIVIGVVVVVVVVGGICDRSVDSSLSEGGRRGWIRYLRTGTVGEACSGVALGKVAFVGTGEEVAEAEAELALPERRPSKVGSSILLLGVVVVESGTGTAADTGGVDLPFSSPIILRPPSLPCSSSFLPLLFPVSSRWSSCPSKSNPPLPLAKGDPFPVLPLPDAPLKLDCEVRVVRR